MIAYRKVTDESGTIDLCETYSTIEWNLKQTETGIVYGSSCVDVIDHYEGGEPRSRYTYTEVEPEPDPPTPEEPITDTEALNIVTGGASNDTE